MHSKSTIERKLMNHEKLQIFTVKIIENTVTINLTKSFNFLLNKFQILPTEISVINDNHECFLFF